MQLTSLASDVKLANVGQITGFTMEANQFSFRVMSDGLYQNKIGSPVREISCNGLDSHIAAGKGDVPITIHLPDVFEPYFSVRDYGLGLDDRGVRETFATYFRSTKRESNESIGAFGLGSKTPFAYTDSFTVVAIKDGRKRQYSMFIGETGLPSIANMGGEMKGQYSYHNGNEELVTIMDEWDETDEGNGVEVIVPVVNSRDFSRFQYEVKTQLAFFDVKPNIVNGQVEWTDWADTSSFMNLDRITVGQWRHGSPLNGLWIVQGPVGYKADISLLEQHMAPENREFLDVLGSRSGIFRFELGDLEVTPSREGLSYSKKTLNAIEALLDEGRVTLREKIQNQVDAYSDSWAKANAINCNDLLRRMAGITKVKLDDEFYFKSGQFYHLDLEKVANLEGLKGRETDSEINSLGYDATWDESEYDGESAVSIPSDDDDNETPLAELLNLQFRSYVNVGRGRSRNAKWRESGVGRFAKADTTLTVLVRDTADKPVARVRAFMAEISANNQVYVLQNRNGGPVTKAELDEIVKRVGASWTYTLLSDVELPERVRNGRTGYKVPTAYVYNSGDNKDNTREWTRFNEKLKDFSGAYYVPVNRHNIRYDCRNDVVFEMSDRGLLDKPILAVREADIAKIESNPDWIPISKKAEEIISTVMNNRDMINGYRLSITYFHDGFGDCFNYSTNSILKDVCADGLVVKDSPLYRVARIAKVLERAKARASRRGYNSVVATAIDCSGLAHTIPSIEDALSEMSGKLGKRIRTMYPLLNCINHRNFTDAERNHLVSYINAQHAGE